MINYLPGANAEGGIPTGTTGIVAGLYINNLLFKPPTTTFNSINLSLSDTQHPLPNCRLYFSQIDVDNTLS